MKTASIVLAMGALLLGSCTSLGRQPPPPKEIRQSAPSPIVKPQPVQPVNTQPVTVIQQPNNLQQERVIQQLFNQPEVDPLSDYIEQHQNDPSMQLYVQQVSVEREHRCNRIAVRYKNLPKTRNNLLALSRSYEYSCPGVVAVFAEKVEFNEASKSAVKRTLKPETSIPKAERSRPNTSPSNARETLVIHETPKPQPPPAAVKPVSPVTPAPQPSPAVVKTQPQPVVKPAPTRPSPTTAQPANRFDGQTDCPYENRFGAVCNDGSQTPDRSESACANNGGRAQWLCF